MPFRQPPLTTIQDQPALRAASGRALDLLGVGSSATPIEPQSKAISRFSAELKIAFAKCA